MSADQHKFWLMKTEPDVFSIDDMQQQQRAGWEGVRNYSARNNLRAMRNGDWALLYHSSTTPPGVAGLIEIVKEAYPDPTQFDPKSEYHDEKSKRAEPRWSTVDVKFVEKFPRLVTLDEIRDDAELQTMVVIRRGRLSVQPV